MYYVAYVTAKTSSRHDEKEQCLLYIDGLNNAARKNTNGSVRTYGGRNVTEEQSESKWKYVCTYEITHVRTCGRCTYIRTIDRLTY